MASNVPTEATLPKAWAARIQQTRDELADGSFDLHTVPGYVPGQPPDIDVWQNMDYLDVYPRIYGRTFGANGIGKLTEVALTTITPNEKFPLYELDPGFFPNMGLAQADLDTGLMRDQSLAYQGLLEDNGVLVHRIEFPDPPVGAYGPLRSTWAANELLVLRGGSVVEKIAISPFGTGRCEYLALWAFANLGIPPVTTITGKGVAEAGPCFWLAEDVFVTGRGLGYNQEGLDQLIPAVARSSGLAPEDLTTLAINFPGTTYFNAYTGQSHHPDIPIGALDNGKVIIYPGGLDYGTWDWLRRNGYEMVEVGRDEQRQFVPCNVMLLEPGLVMMHAEAVEAIAAVRKIGVEVIETPYSEFLRSGGGLHCSTMRIARDPGPFLGDR